MDDRESEVRLSWKEQEKLKVLQEILSESRTQVSAARMLGLTDRWIRTLLRRLKRRGAAGLAHGNRGRNAQNRVKGEMADRVVKLYRDRYDGFNLTHFREMLEAREGLRAPCRETIRQILWKAGVWERQRSHPKHRQRRERREREGELLQMDASIHRWLGPEGPEWALVGAIDDATGAVPSAKFFEHETRDGYFWVMSDVVRGEGVPQAVYTDLDSIFRVNTTKENRELLQAQGRLPKTQFRRALDELGIEWIPAYSPQAKGRIERLWGTFQDRLANELRLAKIRTIEEANAYLQKEFLPRFNRQFRRAPMHPDPVYRPALSRRKAEAILCWKVNRTLANDHTFQLEAEVWQVLPHPKIKALTGKRVEVRRTLKGRVEAWYGEIQLAIRPTRRTPPPHAPLRANPFGAPAPLASAAGSSVYRSRGVVRIGRNRK